MAKKKSKKPGSELIIQKKVDKDRKFTNKGKKPSQSKRMTHTEWEFKPTLQNMGAVLHAIDASVEPKVYDQWVQAFRLEIQKLIRSNGFTAGPKRVNLIRDYTIQLIEGREPENPGWLATSQVYGVPSCLDENFIQYIVDYLKCVKDGLNPLPCKYQVILTILNIHRVYEGLVESNFDSIIEKSKTIDSELLREFDSFVECYIGNAKRKKRYPTFDPARFNLEGFRLNLNKSGPNGLPKLESAHLEAVKLFADNLLQPFKRLAVYTGREDLLRYVSLLAETPIPSERPESTISIGQANLRKLVSVPDKGFKTRVVAICDFWTQLLLEPIRAHVQEVISFLFIQDYRMNQERGVKAMIDFQKDCLNGVVTKEGHKLDIQYLRFFDISAWTDRYHRDLQKIVMKHLFNAGTSEAWAQLTVHCSWYVPTLGTHIKYGQGQGMGTNGSFDIATLTDHLWIHFMYQREELSGLFETIPYGKVGDDLWIYDPKETFHLYCEKINLPINFQKSKVFCKLGSVAEFCSRTAINGIDCSRISPNVVNRSNDFRNIPQLLSVCNQRGVALTPTSFKSLQRKVKASEDTYFDKLQPWLISAVVTNEFLKNSSSPYSFLNADYLVQNNWINDEKVISLIRNQETLMRIMVGNSIVSILNSEAKIKAKVSSLMEVERKALSRDDMMQVYNTDLFTIDANIINFLCENICFPKRSWIKLAENGDQNCVLYPWEIIPLVRLKTLKRNLTTKLLECHEVGGDEPEDILKFATLLNRIAVSVDFDGTHIDYTQKRVYDRQFAIVKFFNSCPFPYTHLELQDEHQLNTINSILSYDGLPVDWVLRFFPILSVKKLETTM